MILDFFVIELLFIVIIFIFWVIVLLIWEKVFWLVLENVKVICKIFVKFFWLFNGFFNIKRYYSDIYLEYLKKNKVLINIKIFCKYLNG